MRATISSLGATLLSKVLGLIETQESSLGLVFHYADKNGLALLGLKDVAGVILRELITFSDQGADVFLRSRRCGAGHAV